MKTQYEHHSGSWRFENLRLTVMPSAKTGEWKYYWSAFAVRHVDTVDAGLVTESHEVEDLLDNGQVASFKAAVEACIAFAAAWKVGNGEGSVPEKLERLQAEVDELTRLWDELEGGVPIRRGGGRSNDVARPVAPSAAPAVESEWLLDVPVLVNGKHVGNTLLSALASEEEARSRALVVAHRLEGSAVAEADVKKFVYVPGKVASLTLEYSPVEVKVPCHICQRVNCNVGK